MTIGKLSTTAGTSAPRIERAVDVARMAYGLGLGKPTPETRAADGSKVRNFEFGSITVGRSDVIKGVLINRPDLKLSGAPALQLATVVDQLGLGHLDRGMLQGQGAAGKSFISFVTNRGERSTVVMSNFTHSLLEVRSRFGSFSGDDVLAASKRFVGVTTVSFPRQLEAQADAVARAFGLGKRTPANDLGRAFSYQFGVVRCSRIDNRLLEVRPRSGPPICAELAIELASRGTATLPVAG